MLTVPLLVNIYVTGGVEVLSGTQGLNHKYKKIYIGTSFHINMNVCFEVVTNSAQTMPTR